MEIPDLVARTLGDEEIQAGVSLGDEDAVCLTPTRTLVYSGEGLLSDESVEEFSHDVERIALSEGRRKSTFELTYVGGVESFSVPADRTDKVLELLLEGVLRLDGVIEETESLVGVYRFSELTFIIAEQRVLKHVGGAVWDEDFEAYPFSAVTRLEFEEASVATSVAISVDGRPQRVKVPNDQAPIVRQDLENALFGYYDVGSLEQLNRALDDTASADEEPSAGETDDGSAGELEFGSGIDPLVTGDPGDEELDPDLREDTDAANASEQTARDAGGGERGSGAADRSAGGNGPDGTGTARERSSSDRTESPAGRSDDPDRGGAGRQSSASTADDQPTTSAADRRGETATRDRSTAADDRESDRERASSGSERATETTSANADTGTERSGEPREGASRTRSEAATGSDAHTAATGPESGVDESGVATEEDLAAVSTQVEELTEAVEKQNELLKRQHEAIRRLLSELRE